MNQKDVKEFCEHLASEYSGWVYQGSKFKNKELKHSEIQIDPSWVLHLSAEPSIRVYNQSVKKVIKESFIQGFINPDYCTARMLILHPNAHNNVMVYRELIHTMPEAEAYIRDFFKRGLDLVNRYFSSPDEKEFLSNYPIEAEFPNPCTDFGYESLGNCIARAVILDFDYVERFIRNELPIKRGVPIYEPYRTRVAEWLPIWKKRAELYGSILKK
ncbi:hypothetical protein EGK75_13285 [Neisseria weixii]|uniref:Uncharacterized protein n=1 Tax=Neisseria weixii TaxID=1853276 RepID=A0A3N4MNC0_9NEIS|nr:hypothetical protein [Neisseria weixii]RPD83166.1 hypothetical protein EGK74_13275 [Neisseria weixii]RPD83370.1 hypothetical protein EGK75_13285 [Neisseria weixii]